MPLYIMYFNLKDGVSEEELVEKTKAWLSYLEDKMEEANTESSKLYRHHLFGANHRVYQMHFEFEDFASWDRLSDLLQKDKEGSRIMSEWHSLMDYKTHYDEFVREIPL